MTSLLSRFVLAPQCLGRTLASPKVHSTHAYCRVHLATIFIVLKRISSHLASMARHRRRDAQATLKTPSSLETVDDAL
jgi:hypothetical protein